MVKVLQDFKKFLLRGNVVDLAVAVVVGTAFAALVKALVAGAASAAGFYLAHRLAHD